jgi:cytoskeletal protein RodZ
MLPSNPVVDKRRLPRSSASKRGCRPAARGDCRMISFETLILLLVVAGLAFYAGLQVGRQSGTVGRTAANDTDGGVRPSNNPLPSPSDRTPASEPRSMPPPRGAPPPASAGAQRQEPAATVSSPSAAPTAPRRTGPPPPASAGLMSPGRKSDS